jgi:hypothetical protein
VNTIYTGGGRLAWIFAGILQAVEVFRSRGQPPPLLRPKCLMQRNTLLIVMVAVGSIFCWWPVIIQPNLNLPVWKTPRFSLALIVAFASALSSQRAGWLMSASILGVVAGIYCGFRLWWPIDLNDAPYVLTVGLASLVSIPVSVIAAAAGVALRESKIARKNHRLIWCAFLSSFVFAPMVVALTPWLLARRR